VSIDLNSSERETHSNRRWGVERGCWMGQLWISCHGDETLGDLIKVLAIQPQECTECYRGVHVKMVTLGCINFTSIFKNTENNKVYIEKQCSNLFLTRPSPPPTHITNCFY
jgi:hypothetical protein